jgi:Putative S-adenosyl-L-methionine-dependent methyltransferase
VQAYSYVLAFEVLDNLPHDCVVKQTGNAEWLEVTVEKKPSGRLQLIERPLQDSLIQNVLKSARWDKAGVSTTTVSCVAVQASFLVVTAHGWHRLCSLLDT